jgi:hypothetical protein
MFYYVLHCVLRSECYFYLHIHEQFRNFSYFLSALFKSGHFVSRSCESKYVLYFVVVGCGLSYEFAYIIFFLRSVLLIMFSHQNTHPYLLYKNRTD